MSRGKFGIPMNAIEHLKKPTPILCDCSCCNHRTTINGKTYCSYYKKYPKNQKKCSAYYGPKIKQ